MDLTSLIKWAEGVDIKKTNVDPKHDIRARTYLNMIVEKGNKVFHNNDQTNKFMDNIQEYLEQLEKIGITPKGEAIAMGNTEGEKKTPDDTKESPLIP